MGNLSLEHERGLKNQPMDNGSGSRYSAASCITLKHLSLQSF